MQAWGNAPGKKSSPRRVLKAQINASVPHIAFVEFDAVFTQKIAILLLKTTVAMVLFLALHVFENGVKLTWAHRERAITALPEELSIFRVQPLDPFRGSFLHRFDHRSLRDSSGKGRNNMEMISDTADT